MINFNFKGRVVQTFWTRGGMEEQGTEHLAKGLRRYLFSILFDTCHSSKYSNYMFQVKPKLWRMFDEPYSTIGAKASRPFCLNESINIIDFFP